MFSTIILFPSPFFPTMAEMVIFVFIKKKSSDKGFKFDDLHRTDHPSTPINTMIIAKIIIDVILETLSNMRCTPLQRAYS